jgi:alpha-beta hydrolase superfamily lysophospholipase
MGQGVAVGAVRPRRRWLRRILIGTVVFLALAAVGLYGTTVYMVRKAFTHRVEKLRAVPEDLRGRAETIALTSTDGIPLKGWWLPADPSRGAVVVLHGMDGLDASCLVPQARFLNAAGWSAFFLDMRAHGRSGGTRIALAFEEPRDVAAALDWLARQPSLAGKPVVLLGLSMGGATAIRTAAARSDVDGVISVSAFASVDPLIGEGLELVLGRLTMLTLYGAWPPTASPVHDIARIAPRPVLVMHGAADTQIPVEHARMLRAAGGANVDLAIVDGADHLVYTEDGNGRGPYDTIYRERILAFVATVVRRR